MNAKFRREAAVNEGWLPKGLRVNGKRELIATLRAWLSESSAPAIGDTRSFHGRFWISADISGYRVRLAADTTREAVQRVVDRATAHPERPWHVVRNQHGRINKVVVADRVEPGWYAYAIRSFEAETAI
jgi:hypothetical protein